MSGGKGNLIIVWPDKPEQLPLRMIGLLDHSLFGVDVVVNGTPLLGMIELLSYVD